MRVTLTYNEAVVLSDEGEPKPVAKRVSGKLASLMSNFPTGAEGHFNIEINNTVEATTTD